MYNTMSIIVGFISNMIICGENFIKSGFKIES